LKKINEAKGDGSIFYKRKESTSFYNRNRIKIEPSPFTLLMEVNGEI